MHLVRGTGRGILEPNTPESQKNPRQSLLGLFWERVIVDRSATSKEDKDNKGREQVRTDLEMGESSSPSN